MVSTGKSLLSISLPRSKLTPNVYVQNTNSIILVHETLITATGICLLAYLYGHSWSPSQCLLCL